MRLAILLFAISLHAEVSPEERLAKAVVEGDIQTVDSLLTAGLNPDTRDRLGNSPIYLAAAFNETKAAERLLAQHADPNVLVRARIDNGQFPSTPLQCAAASGNLRIASLLLTAGARINATGENGRSALHLAAFFDRLDAMKLLLDKGADLNSRDASGATPLDDATRRGFLDAVAILMARGARWDDPHARTGATPLNEASFRGHTALVRYFLQFHPDLQTVDRQGLRPLENAVRNGKEDCGLLLLAVDTAPNISTGLKQAAIQKDEAQIVKALLARGLLAKNEAISGSNPLALAASSGSIQVARLLLDQGADPNAAGGSPLQDAALKGLDSMASLLLDHGALIDQINVDSGTTALYAAASFGKQNVVTLLLNRGANPSLCGKNRKTPYAAALENGYTELAAELQKRGGAKTCVQ